MISIIVPVYNVDKYLETCVASLIAQTYEDFEIILINDGSTDGSAAICDKWAEKDRRVRVLHQENKGLAEVRNKGLELARGEYIAWVDSDDYVDKHYLEYLMSTMETTGADMVMCSFYTDTDGDVEATGRKVFRAEEMNRQNFLERLYTSGMYSVVWNKLLSKEAYQGIQFPTGRVFEDSSVMQRLTKNCNKIVVIEEPLYFYRRHKESITLQQRDEAKSIKYINDFYLWLKEDAEVHRKEKNLKLVSLASRHLCDAIIRYSENIQKKNLGKWKKIYALYKKEILRCREFSLLTKMKYFVGGISFSLCRQMMRSGKLIRNLIKSQ